MDYFNRGEIQLAKTNKVSQRVLIILLSILSLIVILPFIMLVSISISNEQQIVEFGYSIIPRGIDFSAYKYVFKNPESVLNAYKVTATFSLIAMAMSTLLMAMLAYPLSKRHFKGKKTISFYIYFTMLFSGGLVPSYILITQYLHLGNTIWVYIIPSLISPWYVFMMRTFFQDIPYEISESAFVDGASEFTIFFRIIIPLSKPVLATVGLFMFLAKWGDWNTSMLYIDDDELISLQYLLQKILQNLTMLESISQAGVSVESVEIPSETVRMAMAIVVAGPALVIFPFFQKYFVKGLTVGSVKG